MESITLQQFIRMMVQYPSLIITVVLTLAVIFVNGWTDAPNAIATCITTRAIRPRPAILMAAVCNFAGLLVMTAINQQVAETIYNMVDFSGNASEALIALCASLVAIVTWAVLASKFGIPTSESHALIAGLSGAAIAMHGSLAGINGAAWIKVIYGLLLSTFLGFALGWLFAKLIEWLCRGMDRGATRPFFRYAQIFAGAGAAFMHGAQDGQKFMGVFLLGMFLARGQSQAVAVTVPLWLMILCAGVMGLGTSVGGMNIIKEVGLGMVKLEDYQGFASDMAATVCLALSTFTGLPVSTTHTKTTSIMGVGAARSMKHVNWSTVKDMVLTWVLTFPGCGLMSFLMVKLFMLVF